MTLRAIPGSRSTTSLIVAGMHILVLWAAWRICLPRLDEVPAFTSDIFFLPEPAPTQGGPTRSPAPLDNSLAASRLRTVPQQDRGTAITLSTPPAASEPAAAAIDWSDQITRAAAVTLAQEQRDARQNGALTRRYVIPDNPLDPHAAPTRDFRWYDAGVHRIDTRGPLPVLHIGERCVLVAFIIPACVIGHIDSHDDLFIGAAAISGEKLATPRPNDAP